MSALWREEQAIVAGKLGTRWAHVRDVAPDTAARWLELFQRDEPAARFVIADKRPPARVSRVPSSKR